MIVGYIDENRSGLANMTSGTVPSTLLYQNRKWITSGSTETMDWDDVENSDTKDILKKRLVYRTARETSWWMCPTASHGQPSEMTYISGINFNGSPTFFGCPFRYC